MRTSRRTNRIGSFFVWAWGSTRHARILIIIAMVTAPWVIASNASASPVLPPESSEAVVTAFGNLQLGTGAVVAPKQGDVPQRPRASDPLKVSAVSPAPSPVQDDSCLGNSQGNSSVCVAALDAGATGGQFSVLGPLGALGLLFVASSGGGHGSTVATTSSFDAPTTPLSPVPEPSSLLLLFTGLGGASGFLWRRRGLR